MVAIKELSEKPGNCFSCGNLRKFTPCGHFECRIHNLKEGEAILCDTNNSPETDCKHWKIKTGQEPIIVEGQFAGIINH